MIDGDNLRERQRVAVKSVDKLTGVLTQLNRDHGLKPDAER